MFNNILVTFNFLYKKLPVNVGIKCFWRAKFEGLQCSSQSPAVRAKLHLQVTLGRVIIFVISDRSLMVISGIFYTRKESAETSFLFHKLKCSCLVNKVVHFISRLSTCFHHSVA